MRYQAVTFGVAVLSTVLPGLSFAQSTSGTQLEEVIVTAERHSSDLQKTGISVTARNGDDLLVQGKSTLAQMLEDIPGVTTPAAVAGAAPNDNPGGGIVIRGVVPNVVLPGDSSVATTALYADGVYQGIGGDYDIERLEVLRGPQGTLYGRSATSGVVSLHTRNPELGKWNANGMLEYGSYALQHASAAVNVPVGEQVAVRVSGNTRYQNSFLGGANGRNGGSRQTNAGRIKVLYQPNEDVSVLLAAALQGDMAGQGGATAALTAPNTMQITQGPSAKPVESTLRQYWGQLDWNLGFGTLTYLPALRSYHNNSPSVINALPAFYQSITNQYNKDAIQTQELRLASNDDATLRWIAGAWLYDRDYDFDQNVSWQPSGGYSHGAHTIKKTTNSALFGEATLNFADDWRVTAGVRTDRTRTDSRGSTYTFNLSEGTCGAAGACTPTSATWSLPENRNTYLVSAAEGVRKQNNFTFKLRLEHDLTDTNMVYVMASNGFLPGDLSLGQSRDPNTGVPGLIAFSYKAEKLNSYEVGSKNRFLDNTLQVNASTYYYAYHDYQTAINLTVGMGTPAFVIAGTPARMLGAELESLWQLSDADRIGLSAGYVQARFTDKSAFFSTYVAQTTIPGIAPLTVQADYQHRFVLNNGSSIGAGVDAQYASAHDLVSLSPTRLATLADYIHVDGELTANAQLTWTSASNRYSVTGYVRNAGDNVYKAGVINGGFQVAVTPSAPRVYGVVLNANVF
ncbi:MAG: TonB-dependent receptor [Steroidobacteraceae bacterium]